MPLTKTDYATVTAIVTALLAFVVAQHGFAVETTMSALMGVVAGAITAFVYYHGYN